MLTVLQIIAILYTGLTTLSAVFSPFREEDIVSHTVYIVMQALCFALILGDFLG